MNIVLPLTVSLLIIFLANPYWSQSSLALSGIVLSDLYVIDQMGNKLTSGEFGQMIGIKSVILNNSNDKATFTYIVQIKDIEGFTVFLTWLEDLSIPPNDSIKPSLFWMSDYGGDFTVESFIWESMNNPVPLTAGKNSSIEITGDFSQDEPANVLNAPPAKAPVEPAEGYAVDYNVMFVTTEDNCTWEEFGKMHFYNEVTYYYLQAWGLQPTYVDPLCIPLTSYEEIPDKYFGHDLTILMVDKVITEQHLVKDSHAWGYFEPNQSLIVSGEITDMMTEAGLLTEEDIASEWVLTHELAHFVTFYMGEPESIWVDWVHNTEDGNEYCILQEPNDPMCSEIYGELEVNGMRVIVMRPYAYYGT